ncbi:MAG: hypothetical protein ACRCX2_01375 [Paraclostridium sp.]
MTLEQVKEVIPANYLHFEAEDQLVYRFENGYGISIINWRLMGAGKHEHLEIALVTFYKDSWELVYDEDIFSDVVKFYYEEELRELIYAVRKKDGEL